MSDQKNIKLALTGMGMVTPVGLDAPSGCASIRAGISRLSLLEEFPYAEYDKFDGEIVEVAGASVTELTDGHLGFSRFSRLALPAFQEAVLSSQLNFINKIKYIIALPKLERPGRDERTERLLPARMAKSVNLEMGSITPEYIYLEHASAIIALKAAEKLIINQEADQVVIGGLESLVEPATLLMLQEQGVLKSDEKPDGLNPGEASFFIVVESEVSAKKRNVNIIAFLKGIAVADEKNTISSNGPPTGEALSKAFNETLKTYNKESPINMVVSDLNGSRYRSVEWGNALVRSFNGIEGAFNLWHHADCIGDVCSASSGVSIIFAATAIAKGYAKGNNALVWASSDNGKRASLIVEGGKKWE